MPKTLAELRQEIAKKAKEINPEQFIEKAKEKAKEVVNTNQIIDATSENVRLAAKAAELVRKGELKSTGAAPANKVDERKDEPSPNPAAAKDNAAAAALLAQPKLKDNPNSTPGKNNPAPSQNPAVTADSAQQAQPTNMPTFGSPGGRKPDEQPSNTPKPSLPGEGSK
jgi:hypothetical protein